MVVLISFTSIRKNICNYCWLVAGIEVMLIYTFLSFVIQLLFLSFEMMLLLMCFSVSTWGTKLYKIRSSFYLFVFTVFGGIFWVICTVTLSLITGSNNYILDFSVNLNQQISFALMFTVEFSCCWFYLFHSFLCCYICTIGDSNPWTLLQDLV